MALAVPLSRFTPLVGGGSAFFVRRLRFTHDPKHRLQFGFETRRVFNPSAWVQEFIFSGAADDAPVATHQDFVHARAAHSDSA